MANQFQQRPYYDLKFSIENLNIDANLVQVLIISSIKTPYHTFIVKFEVDAKDLVKEDIYGQKNCELTITQKTEDEETFEENTLKLLVVDSKIPLSMKNNEGEPEEPKSDMITFACVAREPFKQMSTTINRIFEDRNRKDPLEAVEDIYDKFIKGNKDIKTKNKNEEKIYQIIIPPMPFIKSIKYLDQNFGLYKGPWFVQCDHFDDDKMHLWDLSKSIEDKEAYEVYFLAKGGDDNSIMEKAGLENTIFYTSSPIQSKYQSNKKIMEKAFNHVFVAKPYDKLFHKINLDMEKVFKENGIIDGKKEMKMNDAVKSRSSYKNKLVTGYEDNDTIFRTFLAKEVSNLSSFSFLLHRNLQIKKLAQVGIPVKLTPELEEYKSYQGKYVVSSSTISFSRGEQQHWMCRAKISVLRGNLQYEDTAGSGGGGMF